MKTIRTRLIVLYTLSATLSLAVLFAVGYQLLKTEISDDLDSFLASEFREITAKLGTLPIKIDSDELKEKMRQTTEHASTMFYIEIEAPKTDVRFASANLLGHRIPDVAGQHTYETHVAGVGPMRVHEYLLPPFDITVATPTTQLQNTMEAYTDICLALLICMLAVSIVIGFGLSQLVLGPLRRISDTARRIHADNLSERVGVSNARDEVSDLAKLLNAMFDRIELAFDQVRRFSDEASHEMKTPLSLIRLHAERILADVNLSPVHAEAIIVQLDELRRLNHIIDELLFLSRAEAHAIVFDLTAQDPERFLDVFAQDAIVLAEHFGCRFETDVSGAGKVAFEGKWIRQVLLNILTNALHVSPEGGLVHLRSTLSHEGWQVEISDEGPGLSLEQRNRMFDRFVRFHSCPNGDRGSGLGLSICQKIIELHGGRIYAALNPKGRGLCLCFELPPFPHS